MFFGLFGKGAKNSLEEMKENLETVKNLMDSNKKDKILLEELQSSIDKIVKLMVDDDKSKGTLINYFIKNGIISLLIGLAINDYPEGIVDIVLKNIIILIKEITLKSFFIDSKIIESLKSLLHTLDNLIYINKLRYTTRILLISLISELCKKFFIFPEILSYMRVTIKDVEDENSEFEEILIFSILMNIFKTDQLILEYENKKLIRRAIIICLSFEEVSDSKYIENESLLSEILIEKLCNYYEMLPEYFELSEELIDYTLEVAPHMKRTFPVLLNIYFEFRDYVFFFNKLCNTIRSIKLKEKLKITLFNKFLLKLVQKKLFSYDVRIIRSNLQYFIFILKTIKNSEIVNLLFNFIFGFNESNSRTAYTNKKIENILNENNIERIIENDDANDNLSDDYTNTCDIDIDHGKHESIRLSVTVMKNIYNNNDKLNIVIITLFETFFERCPYMTTHKLLLPFTEVCLKQMGEASYLLENKKTYPDVNFFFPFLSKIDQNKKFQFSDISNNLEYSLNRSYSHYINNDIDFYYYYLNEREDQENFQYIETIQKEDFENEKNHEDLIEETKISATKIDKKFNFNYFTTNTKQKVNQNKLFDELAEIEEEFKNIHISFMKAVLEKFVNFMNNDYIENLFFTNLIITVLTVPCLEFDPVLVLCQSLFIDENPVSNFSFLSQSKAILFEIEMKIQHNPNLLLFIKIRKEDIDCAEISNGQEKKNYAKRDSKAGSNRLKSLNADLLKEYENNINTINNIILFSEFSKEFVSIIVHKFHFENLVENLYQLYSDMLDSYNT